MNDSDNWSQTKWWDCIGKVENKQASFLLYSGLLTVVLLFDDLFMFHERILKSIGIEEIVMYGIYVILFGILFLVYFRILLSAQFRFFLIITFISFGSSVIIDILFGEEKFRNLFEDGFKFLGIVCWFMFYAFYSLELVKHASLKELKH